MSGAHFPGRILVLGCGSVSQCTTPLLVAELGFRPDQIRIVDFVDNRARVADLITSGVTYEQARLTPENYDEFLSERLGSGDFLLDLAWNIDNPSVLTWCREHNVRYLNTSVELWDPYVDMQNTPPLERTLYVRHMSLRRMIASWGDNKGATAVLEHGANPGLVSHFTKRALIEISERILHDDLAGERQGRIETALENEQYNMLAWLSGTKVIHISERDTQISSVPKEIDEFVNTWSVDGFYEEGVAPAEMGWGTHEKTLPPNAHVHSGYGPCNQICLAQPGMETWVRSWVPHGETIGMVIRHGEAFTIPEHLTVMGDDGNALYRPTVHYAYCPSEVAIASVHELRMRNWEMQPRQRILNDEIISGQDQLGVLLLGHDFNGWWSGSVLSIDEARALVPHQSATTLQVAASIIGAISWQIEHPNEGIRVPDDLPWRDVLAVADKYLGTLWSGPTDWNPLATRKTLDLFPSFGNAQANIDPNDPWQFQNFLV